MSSVRLEEAFRHLSGPEVPAGLETSIVRAVRARARHEASWRRLMRLGPWIWAAGAASSVWMFGGAVAQSDFWLLASLVFSDSGVVAEHWQEFLFSLSETFPTLGVSVILASMFGFALTLAVRFGNQGMSRRYA